MLVHVTMPDGSVISTEVHNRNTPGQDCLDEVCRKLGIIETDYFGLQYQTRRGENMWLNLRNPIQDQVPLSGIIQADLRLSFHVKFHVQPHNLQQESTRHLFYQDAKLSLKEGKVRPTPKEAARLVALILQGDFGDFSPGFCYPSINALLLRQDNFEELEAAIRANYERLRGMKQTFAEHRFLQEMLDLEEYGTDIFPAFQNNQAKSPRETNIEIRVGSQAVLVKDCNSSEVQRINLDTVLRSEVDGKFGYMTFLNEEDNEMTTTTYEFRLGSKEQAEGLYRSITEKYEFFVSDHVRTAVLAQNVRDLKGSIALLLHINSDIGKKYSFDVRRTFREVQEATRRTLYKSQLASGATSDLFDKVDEERGGKSMDERTKEELLDKLNTLQDAMLCKVCMDASLDTALLPCGHLLCENCAERLEECPNCRQQVVQRQRIYMPNVDIPCDHR
ncbi:putative E3 ubiquitin-protein ligase MYLIP-A [Apostichopus japonicus]|uniref:Putative E3 ubiquitin-protein ligase MYLIP-A n=1 Tax=Stichopus japonicus TaxID=307972 RepID=A0A2G8LEN8_STIJA|nr:putative E3 ubiquitin-protein ligase MYLIP-A [Apostichopus japonicus]